MKLESLVQYIDGYLAVPDLPDYPGALNGLQVAGPREVDTLAVAVDASEASIREACRRGVDLLVVHHGIFWGGLRPLTGPHFRRVKALMDSGVALYSCHLPLDGHPEVGNAALLGKALGLSLEGRFAGYQGYEVGWHGRTEAPMSLEALVDGAKAVLDGPVHVIPGGPEAIERVGVVTGGGASFIAEAARLGLDALVTGEGTHHAHFDAMELGVHVLFGGHYATETFGVRALGDHLAERFGLGCAFIDQPTGL